MAEIEGQLCGQEDTRLLPVGFGHHSCLKGWPCGLGAKSDLLDLCPPEEVDFRADCPERDADWEGKEVVCGGPGGLCQGSLIHHVHIA